MKPSTIAIRAAFLGIVALMASTAARADALDDIMKAKVIKVAVPQDFAPFGSAGPDLKPVGYDIDIRMEDEGRPVLRKLARVHEFEAKLARAHTKRQLKFTLPGPMTIVDTVADRFYGDKVKMAFAFAFASGVPEVVRIFSM